MKIELLPHKGIIIENKLIELGVDIDSLKLGCDIENYENMYYLFDGNLQIEAEDKKIVFISCCVGKESPMEPHMFGQSLCRLEADEVVRLLNKALDEKATVIEEGHTYIWSGSGVSCYREMTPEDVEELIAETKADGMHEEMRDDIESDIYRSKHFETISVGRKEYFNLTILSDIV